MTTRIDGYRKRSRFVTLRQLLSPPFLILFILSITLVPGSGKTTVAAQIAVAGTKIENQVRLPLGFERNIGQTDPSIRFEAHSLNGGLVFKQDSVEISVSGTSDNVATVRLHYVNANPQIQLVGQNRSPGITNYILGNDPARWVVDVPTYTGITYLQLYPGIDLRYDGTMSVLKGTYIVAAGANPASIHWSYSGVSQMQIDRQSGDLRL